MSIIAGCQAGKTPFQVNGATDSRAPIHLGVPTNSVVTSTAVQLALPTDPQGSPYAAYAIYFAGAIWYAFNTGSGAATVAGANCYLASGANIFVVAPAGATGLSVILDTSATAGSISIIGIY